MKNRTMRSWEHYVGAHLSPCEMRDLVESQSPAEEWTGTPPSPETILESPAIVSVRQAGEFGSELLLVIDGQQIVVDLSWGHLTNLLQDVAEAIARAEVAA